ncbi:hypothetical protein CDIK_2632 [Cucumispora dikerogammari]|nr:hypothetical protein CDIK_2632 [Cucumispora dikerogammari]
MWRRKKVEDECISVVECFNLCVKMGLIAGKIFCKACRKMMVLGELKTGDDPRWRCLAKKCAKKKIGVLKGSIFEGVHLPLKKIFLILYMWLRDTQIKEIKHELEVGKDGVNTVLKILRLNLYEKKRLKLVGVEVVWLRLTKRN